MEIGPNWRLNEYPLGASLESKLPCGFNKATDGSLATSLAILGPSWSHVAAILGPLEAIFGPYRNHLEAVVDNPGTSKAVVGHPETTSTLADAIFGFLGPT